MNKFLTPAVRDQLASIGLSAERLTPSHPVHVPPSADLAFSGGNLRALLLAGSSLAPVLHGSGIVLYSAGGALDTLRADAGSGGLTVQLAQGSVIESGERIATFDLPDGGVVVLQCAGHAPLALLRDHQSLIPGAFAPPAAPTVNLDASAPNWLRTGVELAERDPLPRPLQARGLGLRFDEPSDPRVRKARTQALFHGDDDPARGPVRAWWNALDEPKKAELMALSASRAIGLRESLDILEANIEPSADWTAAFAAACRERDALESERSALAAGDANDSLELLLRPVDAAGEALAQMVPFSPVFVDPILAQVRRRGLESWWSRWATESPP